MKRTLYAAWGLHIQGKVEPHRLESPLIVAKLAADCPLWQGTHSYSLDDKARG